MCVFLLFILFTYTIKAPGTLKAQTQRDSQIDTHIHTHIRVLQRAGWGEATRHAETP